MIGSSRVFAFVIDPSNSQLRVATRYCGIMVGNQHATQRRLTNVATSLTSFGMAKLKLSLPRHKVFVPCPPHSCQTGLEVWYKHKTFYVLSTNSIEHGRAWPLNVRSKQRVILKVCFGAPNNESMRQSPAISYEEIE